MHHFQLPADTNSVLITFQRALNAQSFKVNLISTISTKRKLSAPFSQGDWQTKHLGAPRRSVGRTCPSQHSPGHMLHLRPTCTNWHLATRKHTAVGMPWASVSTQLCGAGNWRPLRSLAGGFLTGGGLREPQLSCSLRRRAVRHLSAATASKQG